MRTAKENPAGKKWAGLLPNIAITVTTLLVASLLCEALYRLGLGAQNISIVMVLAVFLVAATTRGYLYGLGASAAGVLVYDYLVTEPRLGFSVALGFPITLSIMLLVALATSTVTARIKRQTAIARGKERRAELLYDINRKLLSSPDEESIAQYATEFLKNHLHRTVALFTTFAGEESLCCHARQMAGDVAVDFFSAPAEQAAARLAAELGRPVGWGQARTEGFSGCYMPAATQGEVYGVFGISCQEGPVPGENMPFVELLVDQTAQALRVQVLSRQQREATVRAETEKTRSSFLRGISHDLRTPLTSIIGASATFIENRGELAPATQLQLVEGIQTDAQWLLSMVENILSVTRIQQSDLVIAKTEEAAEEVVGEAVSTFRKRHPRATISIRPPAELLLVPMDALLITQVINNLLDNAQRHTGAGGTTVTVEMREEGGCAVISVVDDGPGIAPDILAGLFGPQPMRPGPGVDATRGMGIGLSICKAIVEAHNGWITAQNEPQGGARFTFGLPLDKEDMPHGI